MKKFILLLPLLFAACLAISLYLQPASPTPTQAPTANPGAAAFDHPPAAQPQDLDADLVSRVLVLDARPWPGGGLPSTLVEVTPEQAAADPTTLRDGRAGGG